jgi:phosphoglycerol transferase
VTERSAVAATVVADDATRARAGRAAWWPYPSAALLSLALVAAVMKLWRADLRVPLTYHAEALLNAVLVKGTIEHGWPLHYPELGAPSGLDLRDMPMADNTLHLLVIKLLALVSSDHAVVMNLFFLLTFPLTALCALYVFRQFGLATAPAICGSLLYTFLPFHFNRGQHHLFLAAYYLVPLVVMVALWIAGGAASLVDASGRRWSWGPSRSKPIAGVIVAVLVASSGIYYAFFACFLLLVAGVLAAVRRGSARSLALPVALVVVTSAVVTAHSWPSLVYLRERGDTPLVRRTALETETYGLRIIQLLLPVTGHRLDRVAQFKDVTNAGLRSNENDDASLGVVGGLGFLALLAGVLLLPPSRTAPHGGGGVMRDLCVFNLCAVLLATIGGFGALVAMLLSSKIRAYNRISVYIAFFAFFAVVIGLDHVDRGWARRGPRRVAFVIGLVGLTVLGTLDQTSARAIPDYRRIAAEYRSDAAFVQTLRAALPRDAMIFQLPVVTFPEHPPLHRMQDYDHARGYLHASDLRWSYGAMKGRAADAWQAWVAAKPPREMIETLVLAGFSGVYLNRDGYADWGTGATLDLARVLHQSPRSSDPHRLLFFDLLPYQRAFRALHTAEAWEARRDAALHPPLVIWQHGCSELEGPPSSTFRWCSAAGEWRVVNGARTARRVTLEMSVRSLSPGHLRLRSPLLSEQLAIGPIARTLSTTLSIPPGEHAIHFECDARRVLAYGDRRHLVFRVYDFTATAADP